VSLAAEIFLRSSRRDPFRQLSINNDRLGMVLDQEALAEMKRLHQGNELTLAEIGARFGRSATSVTKLAHKYGWTPRSELLGYAPRLKLPTTPRALELVVVRMCGTIVMKLDQMEKGMQSGTLTSEDCERDAKSLATLVGNTLKALATGPDAQKHANKEQQPATFEPAPVSDEAERLHREIVERFERIQRSRELAARPE
jgi:hypothetical protein